MKQLLVFGNADALCERQGEVRPVPNGTAGR